MFTHYAAFIKIADDAAVLPTCLPLSEPGQAWRFLQDSGRSVAKEPDRLSLQVIRVSLPPALPGLHSPSVCYWPPVLLEFAV